MNAFAGMIEAWSRCHAGGPVPVAPAKAGAQRLFARASHWVPAFAGTTSTGALRRLAFSVMLLFALPAFAAIEVLPFDNPQQEARFRALTAELRCVMCQNQSLADSNAGIAVDLRRQILDMIKAGKTDAEIKQFLAERYTDFVLYKPPVREDTWILWFGPAVIVGLGAIALLVIMRRRARRFRDEQPAPLPVDGDDW